MAHFAERLQIASTTALLRKAKKHFRRSFPNHKRKSGFPPLENFLRACKSDQETLSYRRAWEKDLYKGLATKWNTSSPKLIALSATSMAGVFVIVGGLLTNVWSISSSRLFMFYSFHFCICGGLQCHTMGKGPWKLSINAGPCLLLIHRILPRSTPHQAGE